MPVLTGSLPSIGIDPVIGLVRGSECASNEHVPAVRRPDHERRCPRGSALSSARPSRPCDAIRTPEGSIERERTPAICRPATAGRGRRALQHPRLAAEGRHGVHALPGRIVRGEDESGVTGQRTRGASAHGRHSLGTRPSRRSVAARSAATPRRDRRRRCRRPGARPRTGSARTWRPPST